MAGSTLKAFSSSSVFGVDVLRLRRRQSDTGRCIVASTEKWKWATALVVLIDPTLMKLLKRIWKAVPGDGQHFRGGLPLSQNILKYVPHMLSHVLHEQLTAGERKKERKIPGP